MIRFCLVFTVLCAGPAALHAQPRPASVVVRDESVPTARRLTEAAEKAAAGKHADAVADLQRILDTAGDDLVPATAEHLIPARWFVHRQLAALPADALRLYRDRIDGPARELLEKGKADRDPAPLNQVVARYFVSRATPEALTLLGELALERGEFLRAETHWRHLLPSQKKELTYPDPPADPAALHARIILARHLQGDLAGAKEGLESFAKDYPTAAGRLAGKTGSYVETLRELLDRPPVSPAESSARTWATLGGDASRTGVAPAAPFRIPVVPSWVTPIPRTVGGVSPATIARSPAFHPVILSGHAYIADVARVMRFDLKTGESAVEYDLRKSDNLAEAGSVRPEELTLPPKFDCDYALTAVGRHLYVRLGTPAVRPGPADPADQPVRTPTSILIRLGLTEKPDAEGPLLVRDWSANPPKSGAMWEGAPVVSAGRILAACVRAEGDRLIYSVACYAEGGAEPLWSRDVADAPASNSGSPRHRHELLTLAGDTVVYCTQAGVVVALNVATGKPAWAFRYSQARLVPQDFRVRALCPPVAAGGRVFVAPADADSLHALDAETGSTLWRAEGIRTHSLLGVAGTKLVAALAGPVRGIRAFDVATGVDLEPTGWQNHDDPDLGTFGQGIVSPLTALWPTRGGLFPLATADGFLAAPGVSGPQGNLAFADGVLVVATPIEVRGYVLNRNAAPSAPASAPTLKVMRADPPRPGSMPIDADEPIPPPVPTKLVKSVPIPQVQGELLIPFSADPPLASTKGGKIFRVDSDAPMSLGDVGFRPTYARPIPRVDAVLLTGTNGLARVRTDSRGVEWTVAADGFDLNNVAVAGARVVVRAGEHHLLAFDLATGGHLWTLDASNRPAYHARPHPGAPRFGSAFRLDDQAVTAQVLPSRWWRINARSGRVLSDSAGPAVEVATPPVPLDPGTLTFVRTPGRATGFDLSLGKVNWTLDAGREASLTGEPPQLHAVSGHLAVAVKRNLGVDLHLVRPLGTQAWGSRPAFLPADRFDVRHIDSDANHLFVPFDDRLAALRVDDGAEVWNVSLPTTFGSAQWIARTGAGGVIVYPTHAIPEEATAAVARRVGRSFLARPLATRVVGLAQTLYESWASRTVPVLVFDSDTGKELRRFDLPAFGPLELVSFTPGTGMTVVTSTKVYLLQ